MRKRMAWVACGLLAVGVAIGADGARPVEPQVSTRSVSTPGPTRLIATATEETASAAPVTNGKLADLQHFFRSLGGALAKGDAKIFGQHLTENARHVQHVSGRRTEGRDAIAELYSRVFAGGRVKSVDLSLEDVRQISSDVAAVTVTATIARNDGPPARTVLDTLLVNHDGKWQLDSITELPAATPGHPFDALKELGWLVGEWRDQDGKLEVQTTCKWSENHSMLERTYVVSENGKPLHDGTQKIVFDAVDGVIRSWNFESDGSFGEGYWLFDGERWIVKLQGRNAAGLNVVSTQIITPTGADSYTTQLVSREVGGKLLPNGPLVKVQRAGKS